MSYPEFEHYNDNEFVSIAPIVLPCIVLGIFVHGNFNRSYVYPPTAAVAERVS